MHGSVVGQAEALWRLSGIDQIGRSKHEAKNIARQNGAKGAHEIGQATGVHSIKTSKNYRWSFRALFGHAWDTYGLRDIEKLDVEHVTDYLAKRIDDDIRFKTWSQEASALFKMQRALKQLAAKKSSGYSYHWKDVIDELRGEARVILSHQQDDRSYTNPETLVTCLRDFGFVTEVALAGRIQLESGIRLKEVMLIRPDQLKGKAEDPHTGKECGWIEVKGKGGKVYRPPMSVETYQLLREHIDDQGRLRVPRNKYYRALKETCGVLQEQYHGSHGLRWNRAVNRYTELMRANKGEAEALHIVSLEMGHERAEITRRYLGFYVCPAHPPQRTRRQCLH